MQCSSTWLRSIAPAATLVATLGMAPLTAWAQQYPNQDIHFICAFPPGSGADVLVRYFAEKVRPLTGKSIIVENKVGAGGYIALEYVARAKPDGYTLLLMATAHVILPSHRFVFEGDHAFDKGAETLGVWRILLPGVLHRGADEHFRRHGRDHRQEFRLRSGHVVRD